METKTFEYIDNGELYLFFIKKEFLDICPNPQLVDRFSLQEDFKLTKYLHNLDGPAAIGQLSNWCSYWIDGKKFKTREDWELVAKQKKFENKIDNLINEE